MYRKLANLLWKQKNHAHTSSKALFFGISVFAELKIVSNCHQYFHFSLMSDTFQIILATNSLQCAHIYRKRTHQPSSESCIFELPTLLPQWPHLFRDATLSKSDPSKSGDRSHDTYFCPRHPFHRTDFYPFLS